MRQVSLTDRLILLVLLTSEIVVFSSTFDGYFFGDSISVLYTRPQTWSEVLDAFLQVHGWYRPFSQGLLPFILFPAFKTNFILYHLVNLILHSFISCLLYFIYSGFFDNRWVAFSGAFFFGVHAINFYTTYDIAFLPEVTFALFYILAVLAFIKGQY